MIRAVLGKITLIDFLNPGCTPEPPHGAFNNTDT